MALWINYVKDYSTKNNMSYGVALRDETCRKSYYESKGKKDIKVVSKPEKLEKSKTKSKEKKVMKNHNTKKIKSKTKEDEVKVSQQFKAKKIKTKTSS
jgi:hypothetical protein